MTPATGQFRLDRHFALPPDRLWHLLTDPAARTAWGAPADDMVLVMTRADLREDGREHHRCGPADAPDFEVDTFWYRLADPALACFSETVRFGGERIATSLVTYGLAARDNGTALSVEVHVSSFVGPEALGDFEAGWTSALDRLGRQSHTAPA